MRRTPIDVGSRKQLLFDELLFASKRDISLVVNRPYQDPDPVLVWRTAPGSLVGLAATTP